MSRPITIIGCGPGARRFLTLEAVDAAAQADLLVGAVRVLTLFPQSSAERVVLSQNIDAVIELIADRKARDAVAVLVTGDPCVHSLSGRIVDHFGIESCRIIPGIGSVQLALSRLGLDAAQTTIVSAHHRLPEVNTSVLSAFETIAILTGHPVSLTWIQSLAETLGDYRMVRLSNLGLEDERIEELTKIQGGHGDSPHPLSVVILTRRSVDT